MTRYVLATANPDKAGEIREVLTGLELVERPADVAEVVEDADTLVGNARLKARALLAATGLGAIADDTGLWVDALNGAPGIHAARYAGEDASYEDNRNKMLRALVGVEPEMRTARFRTVALLCNADGSELIAEGVVEGRISTEPRGSGWGYDPIFIPLEDNGRTFGEMTASEKNQISHRARAFASLASLISSGNG